MDETNNNFNSWSFMSGMIIGMVIRSTDLLPILGGFLLGISIARIPEFIVVDQFPRFLQHYAMQLKNSITSTVPLEEQVSSSTPTTPKLKSKTKN